MLLMFTEVCQLFLIFLYYDSHSWLVKTHTKKKHSVLGIMNTVIFGLKMTSLKKERDSLVQKLQQEGPTDVHRTRTLQRENAQVC